MMRKILRRKIPTRAGRRQQRGTVIIMVLWTAVLLTVLVTAMASKVRLSAQTVRHNHEASTGWAEVLTAINHGKAEIMLENMPVPVGEVPELDDEGEVRNPRYRFDGEPLETAYPAPEDVLVRVYNHAGKINLNNIRPRELRLLIENRLGGVGEADPDDVQALLDAWTDWTDLNDLAGVTGAEREYYESLEPPYAPRNYAELDTVGEILNIRGFGELFEGVNLEAAFTVYGNVRAMNLNLATREAMQLLPGMTDEIIENILAYRERRDLNSRADVAEIVPFENLQQLSAWIGNDVSTYFSVYAYHTLPEEEVEAMRAVSEEEFFNPDPVTQAYSEIIEVRSYQELPRILKVDPYGRLPDTAPPRVREEDLLFDF